MIANVIDFLVAGVQAYILSSFVCRYLPTKHNYGISMIISITGLYAQYLILNYFVFNINVRIMIGMLGFTITGLLIFDVSIIRGITYSLIEYGVFTCLDFLVTVVFFPWMELLVSQDLLISDRLLLGRSLYNVTLYLVGICLEYMLEKKKQTGNIYLLAVLLGAGQIAIMYCMYENDPLYLANRAMLLSIIYNGVVILGYFVVKELFRKIIESQSKKNELEQMAIETRYQYEYYCKAVEQGEKLRDIRHDLRNQLQTVRYLINEDKDADKKRAIQMLEEINKELG